jgi:hypothetical protein
MVLYGGLAVLTRLWADLSTDLLTDLMFADCYLLTVCDYVICLLPLPDLTIPKYVL